MWIMNARVAAALSVLALCAALLPGTFCHQQLGDKHPRYDGERIANPGCDLSHTVDTTFKIRIIVDYSQKLIFNTHKDINRLLEKLVLFLSECCSENPGPECFLSESILFTNRICEDAASTSKNGEAAICCGKGRLERELCFTNLRNNSPVKLHVLGSHFSHEEECLAFESRNPLLVESYIHGLARRLTAFPPHLMSRVAHAYLQLYTECCAHAENQTNCFSTKKEEFLLAMKIEIENENKMCKESKQGKVNNTIIGVIFYTKKKPGDSWNLADDFGAKYAAFASNCCKTQLITSHCFLEESEVLLDRFCALTTDGLHRECCLKRESEKQNCLVDLASQECKAVLNGSVNLDQLCDFNRESQEQVLGWAAYEYSRRNTEKSFNTIRKSSVLIAKSVGRCCARKKSLACLAHFLRAVFELPA